MHNRASQGGNGCLAVGITFFYVVFPAENVLTCKVVDALQRDFLVKVVVNRDRCLVVVVRKGVCAFGNITCQFASYKVKFVIEKCVFQFNFAVGQIDFTLFVTGFKSIDCILDGNGLVLGGHNVDCNVCKIFVKNPFLEGHCGFCVLSVNLEGSDRISFFYRNCNFRKVVYFESFFLACNGDVFTGNDVFEGRIAFALCKVSGDVRFDEVGKHADICCGAVTIETYGHFAVGNFGAKVGFDVTYADVLAVYKHVHACTFTHQCKRKSTFFKHCLFFVGKVSAVLIRRVTVGVAHKPLAQTEVVPGKMSDIIFASCIPRVAVPFDAAVVFDGNPNVFFTESYECALHLGRVGLFEIGCNRNPVKRIDRRVHNRVSQSGNGCFAVDVTFPYAVVPAEKVLSHKVDVLQRNVHCDRFVFGNFDFVRDFVVAFFAYFKCVLSYGTLHCVCACRLVKGKVFYCDFTFGVSHLDCYAVAACRCGTQLDKTDNTFESAVLNSHLDCVSANVALAVFVFVLVRFDRCRILDVVHFAVLPVVCFVRACLGVLVRLDAGVVLDVVFFAILPVIGSVKADFGEVVSVTITSRQNTQAKYYAQHYK